MGKRKEKFYAEYQNININEVFKTEKNDYEMFWPKLMGSLELKYFFTQFV